MSNPSLLRAVAMALFLAGCGTSDDSVQNTDDSGPGNDAGTQAMDAASHPDTGTGVDAARDTGAPADSGATPDTGAPIDSGATPDTGAPIDSGATPETGPQPDAGPPPDAGTGDDGPSGDDGSSDDASDGGPSTVTWAYLYPKYFAGMSISDTPGHCSSTCHNHDNGNSPTDSSQVQAAYQNGSTGKGLSLFGGGMPDDNQSWMDTTAASEVTAWADAGFP